MFATRCLLAAIAAAAGVAGASQAGAAEQAFCDAYATAAVAVFEKGQKYECGYTGPHWHGDRSRHHGWCRDQTEATVLAERHARESRAQTCFNNRGGWWLRQFGTDRMDAMEGLAIDDGGVHIYATGEWKRDRFGRGRAFVAKFDSRGGEVWRKEIGGDPMLSPRRLRWHATGIYLVGTRDEGRFESSRSFLAKFDEAGNEVWRTDFDLFQALHLDLDAAGNVYVAGDAPALLKFDPAGKQVWRRDFDAGGLGVTQAWGIHVYAGVPGRSRPGGRRRSQLPAAVAVLSTGGLPGASGPQRVPVARARLATSL